MSMSADEFVKCLSDSGLIAEDEVDKLRSRLANNQSLREAESLAVALVNEKLLTNYQAKVLLQGDSGGLVLGNYTVLDKIGQGGMGQVFKAWHRRMKRVVAIKTLPPDLTKDEKAIERFRREVETAAQLTHRNIVTSYDADEVGGIHFLVMEYVEGSNLASFVTNNGPMSVVDAIRCILDAAHGLSYAHQQGVVHRDIKPANLLLDTKGMVKILDMGLARNQLTAPTPLNSTEPGLTSEQTVVGTADYLAPEQALSPKRADHRVDIYSLGISFYYLLTGSIPYPGETVLERLIAHRERPIPSLVEARPDVSPELSAICAKMMSRNANDRYASMGELIRVLEDCLRTIAPDLPEKAPIFPMKQPPPSDGNQVTSEWAWAETAPMPTVRKLARPRFWIAVCTSALVLVWAIWMRPMVRTIVPQPLPSPASGETSAPVQPPAEDPREVFARAFPNAPQSPGEVFDVAEAKRLQQAWGNFLGIQVESVSLLGMPLVLIPPGRFRMGTSQEEATRLREEARASGLPDWHVESIAEEVPAHTEEVIFPLLVCKYEVPAAIYSQVAASSSTSVSKPADGSAGTEGTEGHPRPANSVTWREAVNFCNELSRREKLSPCYEISGQSVSRIPGNGYRLLTEVEWEYACRAGTTTRWSFGDDAADFDDHGLAKESMANESSPSGLLLPNAWGLHDMHGNLWEWCEDVHALDQNSSDTDSKRRVVRGGSFIWSASVCRSASRTHYFGYYRKNTHGFRVAREVRAPDSTLLIKGKDS